MTDPSTHYGKDYWDIVLGQVRKRPSVLVSVPLLVLLYAVAIYAPFLANDRPFVFEGTDRTSYRQAHRELPIVSDALIRKALAGPEAFEAERAAEEERGQHLEGSAKDAFEEARARAPRTFADFLEAERGALLNRLGTLRRQLAAAHHPAIDDVQARAAMFIAHALDRDLAKQGSDQALREATRVVSEELRLAPVGEAAEPGRTVELVPFREYPVVASLGWGEVYFMVLWLALLLWPLWNPLVNRVLLAGDRERIRSARKAKVWTPVLLPVLPALVWALFVQQPEGASLVSGFKAGLTDGSMSAQSVDFPVVAYGMAEQNHSELYRPPTWAPSAAIDDEGYYVRGPRAARVDPSTAMPIRGEVVEVRYGEPERNAPLRHGLGTDSLGRDLLSRLAWGGRISLSVGIVSTVLLVLIGTVLGSLAGYFGGWVDAVISRVIEIVQCFPVFFLILIVVAFLGSSVLNIMLALGLFRWTGVARLVRGEFIRLRHQDFVVASNALGVSNRRTIFRHVLPNAMGPVLVAATFSVASGILTESALSFLGFGVQLPIPSWGSLLIESRSPEHWWIQIFPGLLIFVTVILYNLLGEGVRDALDPRLKEA